MLSFLRSATLPHQFESLPDREEVMPVTNKHYVNGHPILRPFDSHLETAVFGLGCFWGAEKKFWEFDGVFTTATGYAGGDTKNPNYEDVCSGLSGHAEVVLVIFDPTKVSYSTLLSLFWESHNPTQGMRQGNDQGSQYRSVIYTYGDEQLNLAMESKITFEQNLKSAGYGGITTEIMPAAEFYYAEDYHQQYLAKNPGGYCGLGGTGVRCA
ncbi:peptide-methionine (S)-S-oxide reductase MsrA [Candidatus Spongiihabitans sp.]|uniref:peptide-methionine (S)-S-oxide reductase MsrA n=1 Tax=Candidatus Spongiihabitans sp. TaxID=3101308 RepID=UPI003C6F9E60